MSNLNLPENYINRELSLLEFDHRVLKQAKNEFIPLLERLKFLFICASNMDEFFEVRVAALKQHISFSTFHVRADGLSAIELMSRIGLKSRKIVKKIYAILNQDLIPALEKNHIHFLQMDRWSEEQALWVKNYFRSEVLPVISPIALDIAHPFPQLANKSLNFLVKLEGNDAFGRKSGLAIVHIPRSIPRLILAPKDIANTGDHFFFLTTIIQANIGSLFPGMSVTGCYQFRVTRNSDLLLDDEEIEDLALALKTSLLARRYGNAVRLEVSDDCPDDIANYLLQKHNLTQDELYRVNGPVNLSRYMMILKLLNRPELRYPEFNPGLPSILKKKNNLFSAIQQENILLHHPYQSFEPILEFIRQATVDPNVLAIKQTLYRTGAESQVVTALVDAARAGKEVTAVIELRARFDEASNIELSTRLQEAGALVVYGVVGYKTHGKMLLVVRRENNKLRYYSHLGTGNYHARTAREYTDFGFLTYDQTIGKDLLIIFQQLTGMGKATQTKKLLYSPFTLAKTLQRLIKKEIKKAKQGEPAYIFAKMNSLTDKKIIRSLYSASQAGVKIDLVVRGICCLRPGIAGISENIKVRSIVGRFLEHSRVFYFLNAGKEKIYLGSADWMERNLYHRVEVCFPIEDPELIKEMKEVIIKTYLSDNTLSWKLQKDGKYKKTLPQKHKPKSCQQIFLDSASDLKNS